KFGDVRLSPGSANCGVLDRLMASARSVALQSCGSVHVRLSAAFQLAIFPLRNALRPILPAIRVGAEKNPNAERGINCVDVSGSPMMRPSIDGSTISGRSPFVPSAFPKPGESDPASTL